MISEYELGQYGWIMTLAFFCWGGSVLALREAIRPFLQTRSGRISWWWLLLIGVLLFGAGVFITDPITNPTTSTANKLHTLCGAFVILTFPIAASFASRSLATNPEWSTGGRWLLWITLLVWLGLVAYFGAITVSSINNPAGGRNGPDVLIGWPNRFMVTVYNIWIILVARRAGQISDQKAVATL